MEQRLLSMIVHERPAFDKARVFFDDDDFSEQGLVIYNTVADYYDSDPEAECVDVDWLTDTLARGYPKFAEQFAVIVGRLRPVSSPNVIKELTAAKLEAVRQQLATALVNNSGDADELIAEYTTLQLNEDSLGAEVDCFNGTDITELLAHTVQENRIQLMPHDLNRRLNGGGWRGAHIFVYARPNAGKTMFAVNLAMGFIKQGLTVLYLGNEDATVAMIPRFASNITGIPLNDLAHRGGEVQASLAENGFDRLFWRHMNPGTISEIDLAIQEVSPDIVIVDQLINLDAGKAEGVAAMDYLAKQLRRLYIKHNVLGVSIGQAGDSAAGKAILTMEDVYGSKTAIQAATDLMLGIGVDDVLTGLNQRMVSITKNKLSPIHQAFPVRIEIPTNKVRSM